VAQFISVKSKDIYAEVTEWKKKESLNEVFNEMKLF
jgi:hypothetical protein